MAPFFICTWTDTSLRNQLKWVLHKLTCRSLWPALLAALIMDPAWVCVYQPSPLSTSRTGWGVDYKKKSLTPCRNMDCSRTKTWGNTKEDKLTKSLTGEETFWADACHPGFSLSTLTCLRFKSSHGNYLPIDHLQIYLGFFFVAEAFMKYKRNWIPSCSAVN